ncbi:MAG TPA: Na/Pi cotransporter family protein [bacterium]|nr:Na/Pi cotransporter family protein [bacterium]
MIYFLRFFLNFSIFLIVFFNTQISANNLENLSYPTGQDKLSGFVESELAQPLKVKLQNKDGKPLANAPVNFQIIKHPSKSKEHKLTVEKTITNELGEASTKMILGDKPGIYVIIAHSPTAENVEYIEIEAKTSYWWIILIVGLIGGVALFIYGLSLMGSNLTKLGGSKLTEILQKLTANQFLGIILGTIITTIFQSSSATTVMLVGLINAGLMKFSQSIGIIFGANIGATTTPQIVAFKLTDYAILFIGVGFIISAFSKSRRKKMLGEILLGFGLLFYGLKIMSDVMYPMRSYGPFIEYIKKLDNPIMAVVVGTVFTAMIQSSGAAISIFIALAFQGILSLQAAIPLTLGANIGTCITAWLASLNSTTEAKRAAWAHIYFNLITTILFLIILSPFQKFVEAIDGVHAIDPDQISYYVPCQIANANTISKIVSVILFLPFTKFLSKLCELTIKDEKELVFKPKYLDENALMIPATALLLAKREIIRAAFSTKKMLDKTIIAIEKKDENLVTEIIQEDEKIDKLEEAIKEYLGKISQNQLSENEAMLNISYLYIIEYIEHTADIINKEIMLLTNKLIDNNLTIFEKDFEKLKKYHDISEEMFKKLFEAFEKNEYEIADEIIKMKLSSIKFENEIRREHYQYICSSHKDAQATTSIFLDILNCYRAINSSSIAYVLKGEV